MNTWRAEVTAHWQFHRDEVQLRLAFSDGSGRLRAPEPVELVLPLEAGPAESVLEPFLALPTDAARALFDALAAHFCGTSDVASLRRDLERERQRYDQLVSGVLQLGARQPIVGRST